jgi:hypothetical protein
MTDEGESLRIRDTVLPEAAPDCQGLVLWLTWRVARLIMARWRAEAIKRLPELQKVIASSDSVLALWAELFYAFEDAYRADLPDESLIARIYSFADWCVEAPRGRDASHDPVTAVTVCFYEMVPTCRPARDDMPRWFEYSEVAENKQVFAYMIGDEQYGELLKYMAKHQNRYQPREIDSSPTVRKSGNSATEARHEVDR